jgi:hypothetical protein
VTLCNDFMSFVALVSGLLCPLASGALVDELFDSETLVRATSALPQLTPFRLLSTSRIKTVMRKKWEWKKIKNRCRCV